MKVRVVGLLGLTCLLGTALWLALLITSVASAGSLTSFEQVLSHVRGLGVVFYATYFNAALITIVAVMLFSALYVLFRPADPVWATIGVAFVPIYGAMNIAVYLSQITVVPRLLELMASPEYQALAAFALRQAVQQWPDSAVAIVNNLAYAVLGIPSVIFGIFLYRALSALKLCGVLLALSGLASIVGFVGIAVDSALLGNGSLVGGVLFLLALAPMAWVFLRDPELVSTAAQQAHRAERQKLK